MAKTDLIALDDWGLAPLTDANCLELLESLEDRHEVRSTMVTSQLPVGAWHEAIDHPTLADAILGRLVHNAYEIALEGEAVRRKKALAQSTKGDG